MSTSLERVKAAVVDGRLQNAYWRQEQLLKLHGVLLRERGALQDAIVADAHYTADEAKVEYSLTLGALRQTFTDLDPEREHHDEYQIAHSKDFLSRRVPVGLVYIDPTRHTMLYSVIVPTCRAIAAGNCVVLKVSVLMSLD